MNFRTTVMAVLSILIGGSVVGSAAWGQDASAPKPAAQAELKARDGRTLGHAQLTPTPNGVLLAVSLDGAPAGEHGFHVHQIGQCDAPGFESAGGHLNPAKAQHGFFDPEGPHAGDLPNVHVSTSGSLKFEYLIGGVTLDAGPNRLLDENGAALVMHANPDDYRSDPAGMAGDRVACGAIRK